MGARGNRHGKQRRKNTFSTSALLFEKTQRLVSREEAEVQEDIDGWLSAAEHGYLKRRNGQ